VSYLTPNMSLLGISIGVDSGITIEQNSNSNVAILDQHNHTAGSGVQIPPSGLNINAALTFQNNAATDLGYAGFTPQGSGVVTPINESIYVSGVDLWYQDGNGNAVQMTSGGSVLATSSGISSGTASASFASGVLVVDSAANTPANIQVGSVLLGNNVANSKFLTLAPPAAMAANYSITLPPLPVTTSIMAMDTSGNITAPYTVDNSTIVIASNVIKVPSQGITATQIANQTITATQIANATITRTQLIPNGLVVGSTTGGTTNYSSTSATTITNLAATLVCTGNPVCVSFQPNFTGAGNTAGVNLSGTAPITAQFSIFRDGTQISNLLNWGGPNPFFAQSFSFLNFIDTGASAGSHTYTVKVAMSSGGTLSIIQQVMVLYELL
jgi:hypothetical protein